MPSVVTVGSPDHYAVLTQVQVSVARDEATTRSIWLLEQAHWPLRQALHLMDWSIPLTEEQNTRHECSQNMYSFYGLSMSHTEATPPRP